MKNVQLNINNDYYISSKFLARLFALGFIPLQPMTDFVHSKI